MRKEFKYVLYLIMAIIAANALSLFLNGGFTGVFWGVVGVISVFGIFLMSIGQGSGYVLYLLTIVCNLLLTLLSFNISSIIQALIIPIAVTYIAYINEDSLGGFQKVRKLLGK